MSVQLDIQLNLSLNDLLRIDYKTILNVSKTVEVIKEGIAREELYPHLPTAEQSWEMIKQGREHLRRLYQSVQENMSREPALVLPRLIKIAEILELYRDQQNILDEQLDHLKHLHHTIKSHIQIEVRPDRDLGSIVLSQGVFILPTIEQGGGYVGFEFYTPEARQPGVARRLQYEQLPGIRRGLENALRAFTNAEWLGTVVVAKNTEFYPLKETALPLVAEKYKEL